MHHLGLVGSLVVGDDVDGGDDRTRRVVVGDRDRGVVGDRDRGVGGLVMVVMVMVKVLPRRTLAWKYGVVQSLQRSSAWNNGNRGDQQDS